jgi:hypothetical protein
MNNLRPDQPHPVHSYPVIIDPELYPASCYPCPPSTYYQSSAPRASWAKRLFLSVIAVTLGLAVVTLVQKQGAPASVGGTLAQKQGARTDAGDAWWEGDWVPDTGADAPRLALHARGGRVTGQLVVAYTAGYLASLPLNGEVAGDYLLFGVPKCPPKVGNISQPQGPDYYLLRWHMPGFCHLYWLSEPPINRPSSAALVPRALDTQHTLVARMTRPFRATAILPDAVPAPRPPAPAKVGAHEL